MKGADNPTSAGRTALTQYPNTSSVNVISPELRIRPLAICAAMIRWPDKEHHYPAPSNSSPLAIDAFRAALPVSQLQRLFRGRFRRQRVSNGDRDKNGAQNNRRDEDNGDPLPHMP